ncbi:MAG: hypothetical protein E7393_06915 [Ruminococcaceae bacterium]|nr:hypothetical protein [Oscillospiraceae bacterium]
MYCKNKSAVFRQNSATKNGATYLYRQSF